MEKEKFPEVVPFDEEERELTESTENDGQWRTVSDFEVQKKEAIQIAKETNRKKPITIRLSQADIDALLIRKNSEHWTCLKTHKQKRFILY
jgi:predicted DNA binding CopG/RHH family protein